MVESIVIGLLFLIIAVLSFVAGLYLAKKDIIDIEKVKLPELPPLKTKPKGAILRSLPPIEEREEESVEV